LSTGLWRRTKVCTANFSAFRRRTKMRWSVLWSSTQQGARSSHWKGRGKANPEEKQNSCGVELSSAKLEEELVGWQHEAMLLLNCRRSG
jgi:hypothetical protein